ncbi:sulfatase-like hydrolase/transferase [Chloroflexi bacterium TSY]|nr:sulfatase-like hydrolase/transferase [Chloroflexi bacterium TSY]
MTSDSRPNFLIVMSDEHGPMFSGTYGHPLVRTPHMDRLAERGVRFENAYCNSPLCLPSRMSFMTGRYIHHIDVWDNASILATNAVTWPHRLRAVGYDVVLAGKQHFVGPDKLHGFRAQLARDPHGDNQHPIYRWSDGVTPAKQPWQGVYEAGPGTTKEIEVDDEVEAATLAYLRDPARRKQPWAINASFIAPHFPLVAPQKYWNLYPPEEMDLPTIPLGHLDNLHPVYQRMRTMFGLINYTEDELRRARAGYYALITYLDDKMGRMIAVLEETGQLDNTVIIYTSDHGEMAGEHGMWRKSNFYEQSSRIPLIVSWPGELPQGHRVQEAVSLVDLVATLIDIAGAPVVAPLDGDSLLDLASGSATDWKDMAFSEYLAHGVIRPMAMLRRGRFKLNYSLDDPVELYDLEADPGEFNNLGSDPDYAAVREQLRAELLTHWNPLELEQRIRESQEERLLIRGATAGEWQPLVRDSGLPQI